jgi:hypothetical protein
MFVIDFLPALLISYDFQRNVLGFTYINYSEPLHLKLELCRAGMVYSHHVEVLFLTLHFLNT